MTECFDDALDVSGVLYAPWHKLNPKRGRRGFASSKEIVIRDCLGVSHQCSAHQARRNLLEHRQPLYGDARLQTHEAGEISTGPRQATKPEPTGSTLPTNTTGMVRVSCLSAALIGVPCARITSGCSAISSLASSCTRDPAGA